MGLELAKAFVRVRGDTGDFRRDLQGARGEFGSFTSDILGHLKRLAGAYVGFATLRKSLNLAGDAPKLQVPSVEAVVDEGNI